MKKILILAVLVVMLLSIVSVVSAVEKITICHLANNNQYVEITVAFNATLGGHIAHPGDIIPGDGEHCPGH